MIISHKHKYLFVELPRTGSTAISRELRLNYDGEAIMVKHATYADFLKTAGAEEKQYFVFSGIRNPLDDAVSLYFKYVTDHKHKWTNPDRLQRSRGLVSLLSLRQFRFVQQQQPDFATYLKRFYRTPYNNWSALSHKDLDYIIRFEHLQSDFAEAIKRIGLELVRPLPQVNTTEKKNRDYLAYYTPEARAHARRVFGPFMQQWGYEFPPEWGNGQISRWDELQFNFFNIFRTLYWKYLRFRI
ncbi:MAG: hypothetical protein HY782_12185 [Chloroflexi bacterium]|nr:hypothetical protein [Chloroflexota bacterium]